MRLGPGLRLGVSVSLRLRLCLSARLGMRLDVQTNLVDPASSHMLVSNIKPCVSQYELYSETASGSLKQLQFIDVQVYQYVGADVYVCVYVAM